MATDLRQRHTDRQDGLDAAHGILVGVLIGLAFWLAVIVLAMILRSVVL